MATLSGNIQRAITLPGGSIDQSGAHVQPLMGTGGGLAIAAATANQAFTVAVAGKFAFMTSFWFVPTALAAVANTITILDSSGGAALWNMPLLTGLAVGTMVQVKLDVPIRTLAAGGQFFISTTGAALTWAGGCNGYYDSALGN
jgi:hypothetical protein